jgi:glycosyltransferase involved in cell wall biosynthesis
MRILHVMASRANGGAETYCADMLESLMAAGIDQVAVIPRASIHHDRLTGAGVRLQPEVLDNRFAPIRRRRLAALIDACKPDLIHCWMRRAASLMPPLPLPAIGWFGGYYDPAHFRRCGHFVGVTPDIVEHIVARGIPRAKAHHVPTFPVLEPGPPVDRASLATPADASVLLALSRLHEKKGLDILLDAVAELPRCICWIAGDGPLEKDLKARAAALGVADRVRFLGWRRDRGALLAAADVCVLPSADGSNGLLVPVDDAPALATAIGRVLADPALQARLIERGRADYQLAFTREAVTQRMIALYTEITAERSAVPGATEGEERA